MARIVILSTSRSNRRLLVEHLGPLHDVTIGVADPDPPIPDLVIADEAGLAHNASKIEQWRRKEAPILIPVLLTRNSGPAASPGHSLANDAVRIPTKRATLDARIGDLLDRRHRSQHRFQERVSLSQRSSVLEHEVSRATVQLKRALIETTLALTRAAEYKDSDTGEHIQRMSYYTRALARALDLDEDFQEQIFHASPMHDIGKIAVPESILLKQGSLSTREWKIMEFHTTWGRNVLAGSDSPYLALGAEIAEFHHEKWNGGGYPHGIAGEAIPQSARILSVCDVYDALRSRRPYKKAFSHEESVRVLLEGDDRTSPDQFDPAVLHAFRSRTEEFGEIFETFGDET